MAGSTFGKLLTMTTWGESHGAGIGVVVDGCPAGLSISEEDIQILLDRRKPGGRDFATPRQEADRVRILSGIFEGKTTGTPVCVIIKNSDQRSGDYSEIAEKYRPSHADYGFDAKFGIRDYRGGGRSSGRETVSRVIAGAVAKKILSELNIDVCAYTYSIGNVEIDRENMDLSLVGKNATSMPDAKADELAVKEIEKARKESDSLGGVCECVIKGLPAGIGEPVFDKLDARLSYAVMGIGAVKAVEIGDGIKVSYTTGSNNNDPFVIKDGEISKEKNSSGGITGGISDGSDVVLKAYFKPTPSIAREQKTVDKYGNETVINIKGRHDPVVVSRACVVVEAMAAVTVLDLMFSNMHSKLQNIKDFYS